MIGFLETMKQNRVPEMSLSSSQNMPIYLPLEKHKLAIQSFVEYCYIINFVHDILQSSKRCLVHDRNMHKIFSAMNLTII